MFYIPNFFFECQNSLVLLLLLLFVVNCATIQSSRTKKNPVWNPTTTVPIQQQPAQHPQPKLMMIHAVGVPKHNVRAYRFTKHHIHSASCTPPTTLPASFAIKAKESIRSVFESLQSVQFRMLFMHTHYSTEKTWSSFLFSV